MEDSVNVEKKGDIAIVRCAGQIDSNSYYALKDGLKKLVEEGIFRIVVDFSSATFVSSAGWGTIIGNLIATRNKRGDIVVTGLSGGVKHVYETAQFDELIKSCDTIEDAIKFFS